ncbi:GSCFA domain-containing protein [Rhizobium sp. KVB221]|uniref:GSCFA domain-containing protein n=1 Tax=Rhizobium setariae TaxID=2801340 RepID=A0A936YMF1_9HYPH|nr:GSCFA domain-containing protein [Rhizobium setariae]MBL0373214.1 GSCFA domain-containing protein [Rhizobium setariae]
MQKKLVRLDMDGQGEKQIKFEIDGHKQAGSHTWFRGENSNFNPKLANLRGADSALKFVVKGWEPQDAFIKKETKVVAFGSCFASNITRWLAKRNYSVLTDREESKSSSYVVRFGEGMVNTFVIRQQFEWAFEGKRFEEALWHGYDAQEFGYSEDVRQETANLFNSADLFIITLGLSEIWYDEVTGGVFWRAVPLSKYDASRHKFRVSSVEENKNNIRAIIDIIKKYKPNAKVIFTLSPIPLVATFRPNSCMTANSVSKSILRAALDEVLRERSEEEFAYYWPSYEIVLDLFENVWLEDRRHVKKEVLDFVMTLFESVWCKNSTLQMSLNRAWFLALSATGALPNNLLQALKQNDFDKAVRIIERHKKKSDDADLELIKGVMAEMAEEAPNGIANKVLAAI